jgi:hypothetical protein
MGRVHAGALDNIDGAPTTAFTYGSCSYVHAIATGTASPDAEHSGSVNVKRAAEM